MQATATIAEPRQLSEQVISVQNLSLTFQTNDGPVHALSDVDLEVGKGDFVSFIGPSGCGKTTLLRVIADLEQPMSVFRILGVSSLGSCRVECSSVPRLPAPSVLMLIFC